MTTHSWDENPTGTWRLEIENVVGASDYGKALNMLPFLPDWKPLKTFLWCYLTCNLLSLLSSSRVQCKEISDEGAVEAKVSLESNPLQLAAISVCISYASGTW